MIMKIRDALRTKDKALQRYKIVFLRISSFNKKRIKKSTIKKRY